MLGAGVWVGGGGRTLVPGLGGGRGVQRQALDGRRMQRLLRRERWRSGAHPLLLGQLRRAPIGHHNGGHDDRRHAWQHTRRGKRQDARCGDAGQAWDEARRSDGHHRHGHLRQARMAQVGVRCSSEGRRGHAGPRSRDGRGLVSEHAGVTPSPGRGARGSPLMGFYHVEVLLGQGFLSRLKTPYYLTAVCSA